MWANPWPGRARLGERHGKHRTFARFEVHGQMKALGQQSLHHQAHLVFGRIDRATRLYLVLIRRVPLRKLRMRLLPR